MISCAVGCHLITLVSRPIVPPRFFQVGGIQQRDADGTEQLLGIQTAQIIFHQFIDGWNSKSKRSTSVCEKLPALCPKSSERYILGHIKGI